MTDAFYFNADLDTQWPAGYVVSKEVVFPDHDVPIKAEINGKKVTIGSGRVDPATGIFHGRLDAGNPNAEIFRDQIQGEISEAYSIHPFVHVSEVSLSKVKTIVDARLHSISLDKEAGPYGGKLEIIKVAPTGHAIIDTPKYGHEEGQDPDGPTPRFHDHD